MLWYNFIANKLHNNNDNGNHESCAATIKEYMQEAKRKKMAKRMKKELWTKIALEVDRVLLWLFVTLIIAATLATIISLLIYSEKRLKPNVLF